MPNRRSSIYESPQGSGKWHGWVWLGIKEDGKPDRRHRRGASRAEVTAAVRKLERARDAGNPGRAGFSKLTVLAWGQQWLQIVADRGRADSTVARYRTDLEMYIYPRVGAVRLSALTGDDIERVLAQMRTDGLSVASRGTCYRTIRAMLREGQKRGRLTTNPLATVLPPSAAGRSRIPAERPTHDEWAQPGDVRIHPRERASRALSAESVRALLEAARDDPDALARWAIAVLCGLRQGEALGLQWGRVNWDQSTLRIDRQLRRTRARHGCGDPTPRTGPAQKTATPSLPEDRAPRPRRLQQRDWPCGFRRPSDCPEQIGTSGLALLPLKTAEAERTIPIAPAVLQALRGRLESQRADAAKAGSLWSGPPPGDPARTIFSTPAGARIDPKRDYDDWEAILRRAGIPSARLHDARHTAATLYLEAGIQERVVQHQFGWSSGAMLPTYQHPTEALARAASDTISGGLFGEPQ
jgi:integrase